MGEAIAKRAFSKALSIVVALAAGAGLSACSFEPPLHLPRVPAGYTAGPPPQKTVGSPHGGATMQKFTYGQNLDADWWTSFHSPRLDALVVRALRNSPTIAAAQAQLRQAQADMAVNASIFYPQVTGNLGASRQKSSGANFGGKFSGFTYSLFTGSVGVSYYPDIFGVNRLIYRGSEAQMAYQRYELAAARLTLAGNVVNTAIGQASTQAQIVATETIIARERALLHLTEAQYRGGGVPYLNVLTQQSQLLASESTLPPLQQQLALYRHQLAILAGVFPSQWQEKPFTLEEITLPREIPVALPSTLVEQRPDIQAAEQQMRYALAQIGVAKAQFFPIVTLSASFGASSLTPDLFFNPLSSVWGVAGALAQPLFEGGKLRAQERAAYAAYDATFAGYRSTVLGAFGQVADALRALEHDGASVRTQSRSLQTARQAMTLAEAGYRSGSTDYLFLLNAEVTYQNARIALLRAEAQRYQDTTALFVALGGDDWGKSTATQRDNQAKGQQP
ncbi:efflux transporter outer membrane subunit [Acidithiobacillus sp. M4-SHS-6]|uniref:efflux transporter outer membrane subunit n=1 Tax=Acidithiobacillus sp. M4-SHS-6 TaxID=3383024 RepID=UPI0039BE1DE7